MFFPLLGVAFALLSVVSSIGKVISPFLLNAVYAKTVILGDPQLTFYIAAAIYIIPITLTWWVLNSGIHRHMGEGVLHCAPTPPIK